MISSETIDRAGFAVQNIARAGYANKGRGVAVIVVNDLSIKPFYVSASNWDADAWGGAPEWIDTYDPARQFIAFVLQVDGDGVMGDAQTALFNYADEAQPTRTA